MINVLMNFKSDPSLDIFYDKLKDYLKPEMKLCVVVMSFFDKDIKNEEDYQERYRTTYLDEIKQIYSRYGIDDITIIDYFKTSKEEALSYIQKSDIVVLPGGAPDEFIGRMKEFEIAKKDLFKDKIILGSSAGAMIQLDLFHISPDCDYKTYSEHEGLDLIKNFKIEVHYKFRCKVRKSLKIVSKKFGLPIYLIPNGSGLIVEGNQIITIGAIKKYR